MLVCLHRTKGEVIIRAASCPRVTFSEILVMQSALRYFALVIVLSIASSARAEEPAKPQLAAPPAKLELADGDGIVFLGDSITHQCLYTQYVEDYFYTRFPKQRINFHNAGVGGDRAKDALTRFDEDVAA